MNWEALSAIADLAGPVVLILLDKTADGMSNLIRSTPGVAIAAILVPFENVKEILRILNNADRF